MAQGAAKRDPAAELRDALIDALIEIPFMTAQSDRRLLIQLIRRDVVSFPDVQENAEIRLHAVQIVLACLGHPGGLRALVSALSTMAPDTAGRKRAVELIESASLQSLLPDREIHRIHELLRRAQAERPDPGWWRDGLVELSVALPREIVALVAAFDHLCARPARQDPIPAALALVGYVAAQLSGPLEVELSHWANDQAGRLEIVDDLRPGVARPSVFDPVQQADGPAGASNPPGQPGIILRDSDKTLGEVARPTEEEGAEPPGDVLPIPSSLGDVMPPAAPTTSSVKLPKVWGDVPQRNPNFTGREELLQHVHRELTRTQQTAVLPQALHGMGGVGKSQVAIEYVHRHSAEYDLVWWVPSEQEGQILASLTQLAQRLKLDVSPEANSAVPAIREALSTGQIPYQNWLLIFDNAEAPKDVKKYFPTGGAGKILVTSRDLDWSRVTRAIEVDVFARSESREFLKNRNPDLTDKEAESLAVALGDLPLAIEQAAAWRAATGMPVEQYLRLLEEKRIEVLETAPSPDYRASVAAAFQMSLDKLGDVNPAALQLLQICSFFAPEPISRDIFAGSPVAPITDELDAALSDSFRLSRAIRDIQKYALARIDHRSNALQIHRLVQAVLIGRMAPDERVAMRQGAHTLLANSAPSNPSRSEDWKRYQALRPHIAVSRAVESPVQRVQLLVFDMIRFLYHWGDHAGSEQLAEEAYNWWTDSRGLADPQTLRLAKWLGFTRWINGKFAAARELNSRTLALYREHVGAGDEGTLDAMYMVSIDLRTSGDFAAARELDEEALAAARREFGGDDPATLICAHSLGVSLRLNGEFRRAAQLDADTHQRRELILGVDDSETQNTLDALLLDLRESGAYLEAAKRQEEIYRQRLASLEPDAPATLRAARLLAVARRKAGDHAGARQLSEETLGRYRLRYGDDYPDTIATAVNYAIDLRHAGEFEDARRLGTATYDRYQRMFGPRHCYTLSALTNLAIILRLMGELDRAHDHDAEALSALDQALGPDHVVTLTCATNLASDLYALQRFQEAYDRDTATLTASERVLGADHPSTLAVGVNLALDLRALGRAAEGNKILTDTMSRLRTGLGARHPATLNAQQSIRADCDVDPMPL